MVPLKLPPTIVGKMDVARLVRELSGLNDFFAGASVRTAGTNIQPPRLSRLINQLALDNGINLLDQNHRNLLMDRLKEIYAQAPSFHISFAAEPSPKAVEKILLWLRQNVHAQTLLQVGLQPSIAAGCVLRTTNKVFDMSLKSHLKQQTGYLTQLIKGAADGR